MGKFRPLSTLALGVAILLAGCGEEETPGPKQRAQAVRLAEVKTATLEQTVRAVGSLRSTSTVELQAETAGRVEAIHFVEGAEVSKGDLLFSLQDDTLRARYSAESAALEASKVRVTQAEQALARREPLATTGAVADEEITTTRTQLSEARAGVQQLEAQLREIGEQLEDTRVVAPFDGRVSERLVDVGDYVEVGEKMATLYRSGQIEAELSLPERLARRVRSGQKVVVIPAGQRELSFDARVTFVSPAVQVSGRSLLIKAVPEPGSELPPGVTPGMSVTAHLVLETLRDRPVVPARALVPGRQGYSIFVVENGTAHRRPIEIGLREPGRVEITRGVKPGERVVSEGHMRLSDGARVRPVQRPADGGRSS